MKLRGPWLRDRSLWGLLPLVLIYLATTLPSLANDPIVGGDEGWIMSASDRLARDGKFGSSLFSGFFSVESHYFFNLPLHHLILAAVFKLFGAGMVQARMVSVIAGLVALALTYLLGRRLGGQVIGLLAAALLVLLRLNLAPFSGLTLTDLGATVRYDLIAAPFGIAAVWLLMRQPEMLSLKIVTGAGLLVGLAGLTQFTGLFLAPPLIVYLVSLARPVQARLSFAVAFLLAVALVFLPYGVFISAHFDDFRNQSRAFDQESSFLSPSFYVEQIKLEPDRYEISTDLTGGVQSLGDLVSRPSARLVMFLVGPMALAYAGLSAWRGSYRHRLLAMVIAGLLLDLMLFESTKRFVYWVSVAPFVCIAIADLAQAAWQWQLRSPAWLPRAAVAAVLTLFMLEGLAAAGNDLREARHAPSYAEAAAQIDAAMPPGASAIGDNRLWPALRHRDYRSLLLLFYFTNPRISRDEVTDVFGAMQRIDADYVLLSPLSRQILANLNGKDSADFQRYLDERTELVATVPDSTYGPTDVYRVKR